MKKSEIITKHAVPITQAMCSSYRRVLRSRGNEQLQIYVWEDGEIEFLSGPCGDHSRLAPRDNEPRELYYVTTVFAPGFDPWDMTDRSRPEDEAEREAEEEEIIAWCIDEYEKSVFEVLDTIIEEAEEEGKDL